MKAIGDHISVGLTRYIKSGLICAISFLNGSKIVHEKIEGIGDYNLSCQLHFLENPALYLGVIIEL